MSMAGWIECVPNISEGLDAARVERLAQAFRSVPGAKLLDYSRDVDHHRSVFTLVGPASAIEDAVLAAAAIAAAEIDLRRHRGSHPRMGALDVVPLIPLDNADWPTCRAAAERIAERLWRELGLPVYFYGEAARRPERRRLDFVRRGGFEALVATSADPERQPDIGGPALHPSAGATAVGVRKFLVAFNVNLATEDLATAREIARAVRESSGGLPAVRALGLALPSRGLTQVSMNLVDLDITPLHVAFERVLYEAARRGIEALESELIGLAPRTALEQAAAGLLRLRDFRPGMILENRLEANAAPGGDRGEPR